MSTIKVQIPVSPETIEREVQLPAYRKSTDGVKFVKVIADNLHVCVYQNQDGNTFNIQMWNLSSLEYFGRGFMDCSKEEFEKAFEQVLDRLSNLQIQEA